MPPNAAFLSPPRVSSKRLVLYVVSGKRGAYSEEDVRAVVSTYCTICERADLDPLLLVSQLLLETCNLTATGAQLPRLDPFGMRSTTRQGAVQWFRSWTEVAKTHAGVVLAYALVKGAETPAQLALIEQAEASRPVPDRLRGKAPTLEGLANVWTTDRDYAERVRRIANQILEPQW